MDLDQRMKLYENYETSRSLLPMIPAIARLDGRSFHNFTANFKKPFDEKMSHAMIETTKYLVEETNADVGYTQSDEISLAWNSTNFESKIFFDSSIFKMTSILASMCSVKFNKVFNSDNMPVFDARVWNVPTVDEAVNYFLWRQSDTTKNSVSMAARTVFGHNQITYKKTEHLKEMLKSKGIHWDQYPSFFKFGTYIKKTKTERKFTSIEIEKLPINHEARKNPNLTVYRSEIRELCIESDNFEIRKKILFG